MSELLLVLSEVLPYILHTFLHSGPEREREFLENFSFSPHRVGDLFFLETPLLGRFFPVEVYPTSYSLPTSIPFINLYIPLHPCFIMIATIVSDILRPRSSLYLNPFKSYRTLKFHAVKSHVIPLSDVLKSFLSLITPHF